MCGTWWQREHNSIRLIIAFGQLELCRSCSTIRFYKYFFTFFAHLRRQFIRRIVVQCSASLGNFWLYVLRKEYRIVLHSGKTLLEMLFEIRLVKSYMKGMISSFPRNMFAPISVLSIFSSSILMAIRSFFLIITPATKSEITAAEFIIARKRFSRDDEDRCWGVQPSFFSCVCFVFLFSYLFYCVR